MGQGITQFVDIGTGLPTARSAHEIAQAEDPDARVVYVDNDPIVVTHSRALLPLDGRTQVIQADARMPEAIMEHPQTQAAIDFGKPVALAFLLLLHFLSDSEVEDLTERYIRDLAPGSLLIISHALDNEQAAAGNAVYETSLPSINMRGRERIGELFAGLDLVEPGLTLVHEWRPDSEGGPPSEILAGGVAVKR